MSMKRQEVALTLFWRCPYAMCLQETSSVSLRRKFTSCSDYLGVEKESIKWWTTKTYINICMQPFLGLTHVNIYNDTRGFRRTMKTLFRLCGCTGRSELLLKLNEYAASCNKKSYFWKLNCTCSIISKILQRFWRGYANARMRRLFWLFAHSLFKVFW